MGKRKSKLCAMPMAFWISFVSIYHRLKPVVMMLAMATPFAELTP